MGRKVPDTFNLIIYNPDINARMVINNAVDSGIWFSIEDYRHFGPFRDQWLRMKVVIRTKSKTDAKRLRKAIGCTYNGVCKNDYQYGDPYFKQRKQKTLFDKEEGHFNG